MQPLIKLTYNQDLFFILIILSFLLIALIKGLYWKHAKLLFMGVFAQRYANQYLREESVFTQRVNILTSLLMIVNFTLLVVKICFENNLQSVFLVFCCICAYFFFKIMIIKLLGLLFKLMDLAKLTVFFTLMFDRTFGFLLSPMLLFICFFAYDMSYVFISISFFFFVSLLLLKVIWLWRIGTESFGLSRFYIFLYLCIFEITPILFLFKDVFY